MPKVKHLTVSRTINLMEVFLPFLLVAKAIFDLLLGYTHLFPQSTNIGANDKRSKIFALYISNIFSRYPHAGHLFWYPSTGLDGGRVVLYFERKDDKFSEDNVKIIEKHKFILQKHLGVTDLSTNLLATYAWKNILLRDYHHHKNNPDKFSSNRFDNWNTAINIIKKNYLRGYGAQADRILINQSIHNSFLYSTLSGGILSGLSIIFIYIFSLILLIKFYLSGTYKICDSALVHFAASILIIIGLRSILETSFAVFSIDFLIFIIAFLFFQESLKKYQ